MLVGVISGPSSITCKIPVGTPELRPLNCPKTELAVSALQVEYPAPKNVVVTIEFTTNTRGIFCVSLALLFIKKRYPSVRGLSLLDEENYGHDMMTLDVLSLVQRPLTADPCGQHSPELCALDLFVKVVSGWGGSWVIHVLCDQSVVFFVFVMLLALTIFIIFFLFDDSLKLVKMWFVTSCFSLFYGTYIPYHTITNRNLMLYCVLSIGYIVTY